MKYLTIGALSLASFILPNDIDAQSKKDPTPVTDIGNYFFTEEISLAPIYSKEHWNNSQTSSEKRSKIEQIIQEEGTVRTGQNYSGNDLVQSFINLTGISDISSYIENRKNSSGFVYDSTYNGKYNVPARTFIGTKNGNQYSGLCILLGDNPLDVTNYYFWDPSTKEEINLDELGSDSPISIGTIAKRSEEIFTAIPDIIKFEMENNQQKSINYLQGYLLRFSPNKSWLSITAPNDTTITEEDPDLLSDKYGVVKVSSNPQEGSDFYFTDGNKSIEGEHLIKQTSSLVDTTYFTPDKKHYQVRKKTLVELIEKNTWKTPLVPQGAPFEHILKKDSVYQTINVDLDTGVGNEEVLPTEFNLYQNYPNPFNPTTTIKFTIPTSPWRPSPYQGEGMRERLVTLRIYDALGREIKTLINEQFEPGEYELKFDGSDLPSGIYFYKLSYGNQAQTRKMMLLK